MTNPMLIYLPAAAIIIAVVTLRTTQVKNAGTKNHLGIRNLRRSSGGKNSSLLVTNGKPEPIDQRQQRLFRSKKPRGVRWEWKQLSLERNRPMGLFVNPPSQKLWNTANPYDRNHPS